MKSSKTGRRLPRDYQCPRCLKWINRAWIEKHHCKTPEERAWLYIDKVPRAVSGENGHTQTFIAACILVHGFNLCEKVALALLKKWNEDCKPPWNDHDLNRKIKSAAQSTPQHARGYLLNEDYRPGRTMIIQGTRPKAKAIDPTTAAENFLAGAKVEEVELWEASPIRPEDDWKRDPLVLLESLYQPQEFINIVTAYAMDEDGKATPKGYGTTRTREEWLKRIALAGAPEDKGGAWFRINPTDGHGISDANITAFRYALVEADKIPAELQLSLFAKLPLPIAAILTSGGRSLHALVRVDADNAENYRATVSRMLLLLSKFGIDTKNKNPSRMSRLPGAQRIIGAQGDGLQKLLYLNPKPEQRPIL